MLSALGLLITPPVSGAKALVNILRVNNDGNHGVAACDPTIKKNARTATRVHYIVQWCIMQKYVREPEVVEAVQFTTNNEADNRQMNEIVDWVKSYAWTARHDGTDIFIENRSRHESRVAVGDWIIKHTQKFDCVFYSVPHYTFEEAFELCNHLWEAVDDSDYDQCLVCGDTRLFEMQYFGDEVVYSQDGNMRCCVFDDFENLQESPAGFGETDSEAMEDLLSQVKCETCDGDGRVLDHNKFTVDKGKWMRSFDETISIECPDCSGSGYSR